MAGSDPISSSFTAQYNRPLPKRPVQAPNNSEKLAEDRITTSGDGHITHDPYENIAPEPL